MPTDAHSQAQGMAAKVWTRPCDQRTGETFEGCADVTAGEFKGDTLQE
jgi:hypothetical protein